MPELNRANRQVCDVDIRVLKTLAPFLFLDTANTTTAGLTGDAVYAMAKGQRAIAFHNPLEGTMTIEAQVLPFRVYALYSDGVIETKGTQAVHKTITATDSTIKIESTSGTVRAGTVFVYPAGSFGDESAAIAGTFASGTFTPTETSAIVSGQDYEVGYILDRTSGVRKVSFNNKKVPKDYFITMNTVEKDEDGTLVPYIITAYKAAIERNLELSFSSEGDPASLTITFNLMADKDGNVMDIMEDTENAE